MAIASNAGKRRKLKLLSVVRAVMSQAPASSTFPLLNVGPIVDVCKDWGLVLNEEDIAAPTPAKVQSIYEWWMAAVLSLNAEDCTRAAEAQLDHMDDAVRCCLTRREAHPG